MSKRWSLAVAVLVLASLALAACGGGGGGAAGGATTVDIKMEDIKFTPNTINAKVGQQVTVNLTNAGTLEHTFTAPDFGVDRKVAPGARDTVTFTPTKAGTFRFDCTVPGHKEAGMVGTITVSQ